jgi:two-component system, cell cycle response regulator CpdR
LSRLLEGGSGAVEVSQPILVRTASAAGMATILIAEDDGQMRTFLAAALRRAGHYVEAVECGEDALEALDNTEFNLLLADVVMPGMDGIELARVAGERHPEIKVMFITGFAAVAMKTAAVSHGQPRVLSKPVHLKDLIRAVDRLLAD